MIRVLDGQSPDDILNAELGFLEKIGLKEHLSPTRSNGLTSMVKQMKLYALAFKTAMKLIYQTSTAAVMTQLTALNLANIYG